MSSEITSKATKMKTEHHYWTVEELVRNIEQIEFPEFQREPTVWKLDKKQRLIDSMLRDFDISSIYFYKKETGGWDCIDGRQRINAILSYLGINYTDEDDNGFLLKIDNEIYSDEGKFTEVDQKRYSAIKDTIWGDKIRTYELNIVEVTAIENDQELNLLFLRLQIAAILNAGEKLHAMTGDMREAIFYDIGKHAFFDKIKIPGFRFAREQVAAQIVLNEFSKRDNNTFHKSRYVDLQDFFKEYNNFTRADKETILSIKVKLDKIVKYFGNKLQFINNRATAVSVYLCASQLIDTKKETEIKKFVEFFEIFLKTLKWQLPLGVQMHSAYWDLLKFQTNISQAAGEKSAIERRHDFLNSYFLYYKETGKIKGDDEYLKSAKKKADIERQKINL
jgi:hypothetical protein